MDPERVPALLAHPTVEAARARFVATREEIVAAAITIQQIAAPTGEEARRAAYIREQFERIGLAAVRIDEVGNVYGCYPGHQRRPAVAVAAHLDTVFPVTTDLSVWRDEERGRIYGPGLGDNSLGLAGLVALADVMQDLQIPVASDIWFVADVGEEGLGNLRGMRAATDSLQDQVGSMIALEGGGFGMICHQGVGVRRLRLTVQAPGGHAWSDFGAPSAIHVLLWLGAALADLRIPPGAGTSTFNIGVVQGGTSVNTIAAEASLLLELRSETARGLDLLEGQVERIVAESRRRGGEGVRVVVETIGERPSGAIPRAHPLTRVATAALEALGLPPEQIGYRAGSTDANLPLSRAIPALCLGLTDTDNAHRQDEYIHPERLPLGLTHVLLVLLAAAGGLVAEG